MQWVGKTHVGLVRDHNEDAFFVDTQGASALVADGMGGHESGEVASAIAIDVVKSALRDQTSLPDAIRKAHAAILKHPKGGGFRGMGTTAVGIIAKGTLADIAWVGDSRAYLFDGDRLQAISKDHTPLQELVDAGRLTPEQARVHPRRNEITQALGLGGIDDIEPGQARVYLGPKSIVLLCSDGLTEHLTDLQIEQILQRHGHSLEKAADLLIDAALDDGGTDNITVVLAKQD